VHPVGSYCKDLEFTSIIFHALHRGKKFYLYAADFFLQFI